MCIHIYIYREREETEKELLFVGLLSDCSMDKTEVRTWNSTRSSLRVAESRLLESSICASQGAYQQENGTENGVGTSNQAQVA